MPASCSTGCAPACAAPSRATSGADRVAEALDRYAELAAPEFSNDEVPMLPQRIIGVLHEAFPDDATITCDAGENRLFMMHWYRSKTAPRYLQPAAGGGMGYAVPAAHGRQARHARPSRARGVR